MLSTVSRKPQPRRGLPPRAGLGLKLEHVREILEEGADIGFFEVHPENYMGAGGAPHHFLTLVRQRYPLSLHGVGLSIGAARPLDRAHLANLKALVDRYEPASFSEHLAWSTHDTGYLNDLLPLPYTQATLAIVADHVAEAQEALGRPILLENPATYLQFAESDMSETEFLAGVAARSGCGLLLDVNNVFVSASNHGFDPVAYLDSFPMHLVGEMHLAGHAVDDDGTDRLLIDTHDRPVADPVWELYARVIGRNGPLPTLVEWDSELPEWAVLRDQASQADGIMAAYAGDRVRVGAR
jgi:uncharacterized protein